jgi:hypothetical protein
MAQPPTGYISYGKPPPKSAAEPGFTAVPGSGRQPLDWITEFAIPLGIIGLLGSFLYYLIHLRALVGGGATVALMWVCFFFLLGTVFVTRVRTKYGESAIAAPYVIGLAAAIGLFIFQFTMWAGSLVGREMVGGRIVDLMFNYAVVALIWYGASRLTRECTAEDTTRRAGEEGMLNDLASGADRDRPRTLRDRRVTKHPGWLVMWFSLLAVTIFALGQRAAISISGASAPFAFTCLVAYLFFAMALLALTSLSALRMQVRQRRISISGGLGPAWIWLSAMAICAILAMAGILPRRDTGLKERDQDTIAQAREQDEDEGMAAPIEGQRQLPDQDRTGEGRDQTAPGDAEAGAEGAGDREGTEGEGSEGAQDGGAGAQSNSGEPGSGQGEGQGAAQQPTPPDRNLMWLVRLIIALLLLLLAFYVLYRLGRAFVAWLRRVTGLQIRVPPGIVAFLQRLQALFARLLYLLRLRRLGGVVAAGAHGIARETLIDPFADRSLADKPPAEKVQHVYRAMLAYADLLECPRTPEQTPLEYIRSFPVELAPIREEAHTLTRYFVQASYTPDQITDEQVDSLRGIWRTLQRRIDAALAQEEAPQPA